MSDLCLEKIKNMLGAHDDGVYALEARENLYDIISYLVMELEISDNALRGCGEVLDICQTALCEVQHAQEQGAKWYTQGDRGLYMQVRMWVTRGLEAINKARGII